MNWKAVVTVFCSILFGTIPLSGQGAGIESISMPQADVFIGFVSGGLVGEVSVREGVWVRKGTVLARLDDSAERIELERLTALAEDTTRLEAAEADLAQKRADLKKLQLAREHGAATELEIEHATLAVTTAELQVRMEKFQRLQNRQNRDALQAKLERMQIISPVGGSVEEIRIEPGESVEPLAPVIRVVQNDPLWIDVPVPLAEARGLKLGSSVKVVFPDQTLPGRVVYLSTVADAGNTRRIRVEVPNPQRRVAGERVLVDVAQ